MPDACGHLVPARLMQLINIIVPLLVLVPLIIPLRALIPLIPQLLASMSMIIQLTAPLPMIIQLTAPIQLTALLPLILIILLLMLPWVIVPQYLIQISLVQILLIPVLLQLMHPLPILQVCKLLPQLLNRIQPVLRRQTNVPDRMPKAILWHVHTISIISVSLLIQHKVVIFTKPKTFALSTLFVLGIQMLILKIKAVNPIIVENLTINIHVSISSLDIFNQLKHANGKYPLQ